MCAGEVHIAMLDSFAYILASERGCADAELSSIRASSGSVYEAQIMVRFDSGIETYEDMRGKTLCRTATTSKSGWLVPNLKLRAEGIDPENDFAEIIEVDGHAAVVEGIYNGDCHVGATYVDARVPFSNQYADALNVVHVFVQTIQIPFESISFIPGMPLEMRTAFTDAFWYLEGLNAGQIIMDMYGWQGFLERHDYLYDPMRELIEASGVPVESLVP
jgi:phosphonate transport system substrate-binding protein